MKRLARCMVFAVVVGFSLVHETAANAGDVVVGISGTLGSYSWDPGSPVSDGSFAGNVTFSALPAADSSVTTGTADISFFSQSDTLVFRIQYDVYASMTANATDFTALDVSGYSGSGDTGYHIDGLLLNFSSWPVGGSVGTVNVATSSLEFQDPTGTTWFNPLVSGQASVPEPSSILLGLVGMAGCAIYVRCTRRKATV